MVSTRPVSLPITAAPFWRAWWKDAHGQWPRPRRRRRRGGDRARGDMGEARAADLDHAPAHGRQAGVQAENANRQAHGPFVPLTFGRFLGRIRRISSVYLPRHSKLIDNRPITGRP